MKKVLITGGAGFIGSHLVEECLSRGWEVHVLDSLVSGKASYIHHPGVVLYTESIVARIEIDEVFDYVFHLAAEPYIPYSYMAPRLFCETNIIGTLSVLDYAKRTGVKRVLVVSTSEVYGTCSPGTELTEKSPLNPISTYAVTKLAADRLSIARWHEDKVPVIIFRPFNCFGPRATQEYVIPEIIAQAIRGDTIKLGNTESVRDFSYVADTAWAMAECIEKGTLGEVYHYGSGLYRDIGSIVVDVENILNKRLKIVRDEGRFRPVDVTWLWADNSKFDSLPVGEHYDTVFFTGLQKTIEWFQNNGNRWAYEGRS